MGYQGGKSRIAKQITEIISTIGGGGDLIFVSLFCGSCPIESAVMGFDKKILNDKHEYLIAMLDGVKNGYELPENISEEQYKDIRNNKDRDKVLTGFAGFGCSFGGKWFGGYARNSVGRNYAKEAKRGLLLKMETLKDADFICRDYKDVELPKDCVVYADPPYDKTTGYGKEKFNSEEFWEYMRGISKTHIVFISEQNAPIDFVSIWEKPLTRTLDANKNNQFQVTEKLFVYKDSEYLKRKRRYECISS